jgi:SAM-dependent methyltransferase
MEDLTAAQNGKAFDTIICLNVMEHIKDDHVVLDNFYKALTPGGRAIILVPHDPDLYTDVDKTLGHYRRYTQEELAQKLQKAGFKVLRTWGFNRVGGLGWRVSGKLLGRKTLSAGQMKWFEILMPISRLLEKIPFHSHTSVICVGEKPKESKEDGK